MEQVNIGEKYKYWHFVQLHYPHSPQKNNTNG